MRYGIHSSYVLLLWHLNSAETHALASLSPQKHVVVASNLLGEQQVPMPSSKHKHNIRQSRRKAGGVTHNLKPGAYHDSTEEEIYTKTMDLLQNCGEVGEMTAGQAHEAGRLLIAWSKRYVPQSGEMSELLLRKLVSEKAAGNQKAKPGLNLFNSCMNAWIKCGKANGYQKAFDLLEYLNEYLNTHSGKIPKQQQLAKCYATVIAGCCSVKTKSSADVACELLEKMDIDRQVKHYNAVLNIYASIYDHKSVLRIFQQMKELRDAGEKSVAPNRTTFNIVIKALSGCKEMNCVRKAEEILTEMENAYFDGNRGISPDKISYTSILAAWSHICNKQAVEKAEMYLERMHIMYNEGNRHAKPDAVTYNTVLNIIANSRSFDAGARSLKILSSMEQLHELGAKGVKPNLISYNAVRTLGSRLSRRHDCNMDHN